VTFDGVPATVVSASATRLVVRPGQAVYFARHTAVSVEARQQVSNAVSFELVPSGTTRTLNAQLIHPGSVVRVGMDLYVGSNGRPASAGLFRIVPDGRVLRVGNSQVGSLWDIPVAMTTNGSDIWYTTTAQTVRRYHVALGRTSEVAMFPSNSGNTPSYALRGIARTTNGYLFVVDQSLPNGGGVHRISPTGSVTTFTGPEVSGAWAIAAYGTDVYVALASLGSVTRISNAEGAYTVTGGFAYAPAEQTPLIAMTATSDKLIVANVGFYSSARLLSVNRSTGGQLASYGDPAGYGQITTGMWSTAEGDLYLAQPQDGTVRKISAGNDTTTTLMSAGGRLALGVVRMNGRTYVAGASNNTYPPGPPAHQQNGTIAEFSEDGSGRLLLTGGQFRGMVALSGGRLAVSDCTASRIFTLDPATGGTTDLLTAADGLSCPLGLVVGPAGELFYVNRTSGGATIGRYTPQGNNLAFVTGVTRDVSQVALAGSRLLAMGLGLNFDGELFGLSLYSADVATGGGATSLLSSVLLQQLLGMGTAPSGVAYLGRSNGEILTLDGGGTLTTITSMPQAPSPNSVSNSFHTFGFDPDGTAVVLDIWQGDLVAVAP
jgi:sugar lactone lactonase YvrE